MPKEPEAGVNLKIPLRYWEEFHKRKEKVGKPIKVQVVEAFRAYLYPGGEKDQVVRTGSIGGQASEQNPGPASPRSDQPATGGIPPVHTVKQGKQAPKPKPRGEDW